MGFRLVLLLAIYFLGLGSVLGQTGTKAEPFEAVSEGIHPLLKNFDVIYDETRTLTLADVLADGGARFSPPTVVSSVWHTKTVGWARFTIDFQKYSEDHFYLIRNYQHFGALALYRPSQDGYKEVLIEANQPYAGRELKVRQFVFRVPVPDSRFATYYIKYTPDNNPLRLGLEFASEKSLIEEVADKQLWQGVLLGIFFALFSYNLFLWVVTREKSYAFYVLYLSLFIVVISDVIGLPSLYLEHGEKYIALYALAFYGSLAGMVGFSISFFELRSKAPVLYRLALACALTIGIGSVHSVVRPEDALQWPIVVAMPCMVITFIAGLVRWRQGFKPALFCSIGWAGVVGVFLFLFLQYSGISKQPGDLPIRAFQWGCAWEAIWFSVALGYRIKMAEDSARKLLISQQETMKSERHAVKIAENAVEDRNRFISMISHELRTPLQSILSGIDMLERKYVGSNGDPYVKRIRWGSTALNRQLEDVLTLSQGQAGRLEMRPETFDAVELVRSAIERVSAKAAEKGLEARFVCDLDALFVVADPARIDQVLHNLLDNAVKYTEAGQVVLVLRYLESRELSIVVKDSGVGISEERIPLMTEPFRRVGTLRGKREGVGIGLAVTDVVLRNLGGSMTVTSAIGAGSEFSIRIPIAIPHHEIYDQGKYAQGHRRVLLVDDQASVLEALLPLVKETHHDCEVANSAAHAANIMAAQKFDVIFIDLNMPTKDGYELASETRRGGGINGNAILVAMTANSEFDKEKGWAFDRVCRKPISTFQLFEILVMWGRPEPLPPPLMAAPLGTGQDFVEES